MKNKKNTYIISSFIIVILIGGLFQWYSTKELNSNGKFTIATIEKVLPGGKGCGFMIDLSYYYKGEKYYLKNNCVSGSIVGQIFIKKKLLIKFTPNNDNYINIYFDIEIPKSIVTTPYGGWDKEWVNKNLNHFQE